jgi:hypothetical protein
MKITLHDMEHIEHTYHQSELVLIRPVIIILVAIYLPWYFALQYGVYVQYRNWLLVWTLIVLAYAIREYMVWSLNRYIITNKRLIRVSHDGVFKKTVVETPWERVLNVSYKTIGLLSSLFVYGNVEVQVVGLMEPIILEKIKHPRKIKDYLWEMHQRYAGNNAALDPRNIPHIQERIGYTKHNQKIL